MILHRLRSLRMLTLPVRLFCGVGLVAALPISSAFAAVQAAAPTGSQAGAPSQSGTPSQQQPAPPPQQQPQQGQGTPTPQQQPQNPFENVPQAPQNPTPSTNNAPQNGVQEGKTAPTGANIIEAVEFRGQRRVNQDFLRALVTMKKGDVYDEAEVHRDFIALWNSGRFDDIQVEKETAPDGGIIVRFLVTERRTVHTIDYTGFKSISKSEILDRFKDRKVALSPESQYDPGKVQRAKNVLQEYLAERGHQYATVTPQIRQVPPGGVDITFAADEGPKVKVGHIDIQGNSAFSDRVVIRSMKNLKPIGIPYSILFENLFARTYDSTKLDEDSERIRQFYQSHGYFTAKVISHNERVYDTYGRKFFMPFMRSSKPGKHVDVTMVLDEGQKYYLRNFNFNGMKLFRTPDLIARQVFGMSQGDVFSTEKLQKGLDNLRKLYGDFGYIDFVPSPDPEIVPGKNQVDLTIDVDEGHQFFVRRIDFQGNTSTRDRVIRRELLVDEGDLYSQRLWDTSILRLNQLGYFDPLKPEDATDIKRDTKTNTVDLLLKVHERGKNSIQLNGGVSGIEGSFVGFSYSTNNFLGLGETLSLSSQIGTLMSSVSLGFTEPYLFGRPIQAGVNVYYQRYNYDQARQYSIFGGADLRSYYNNVIGTQNLLNYVSNGRGFTVFSSYQLKRSFARVGLTYGYSEQNLKPTTPTATSYFTYIDFQGVGGPNSLEGITASTITPTFSYNTVNHPIIPTKGLRVNINAGFTGSVLGGNVNMVQPGIDIAYFRHGFFGRNVIGIHFNGRFIAGYGGKVAPPYSRFYMGGEDDIRGFDFYTISPIAYIPSTATIPLYNANGTPKVQPALASNGSVVSIAAQQTIPIYQLIEPGGDTSGVVNLEYRIPIVGPVTLAPFVDAGIDRLTLPGQLGLNALRVQQLDQAFPQEHFNPRAIIAPGTQIPRMSVGLELQVLMPVVNAPFRVYWAYNPSSVQTTLNTPIPFSRSAFPNDYSYQQAIQLYAPSYPYNERTSTFRFSVGRTF